MPNQPASPRGRGTLGLALFHEFRIDRSDHIAGKHLAAADGGKRLLDRWPREPRQGAFQLVFGKRLAGPFKSPGDDLAAESGILRPHGIAGRPPNRRACLAGHDQAFPYGGRGLAFGAGDLDLIAVLQFGQERGVAAIDLGADRGIADIGMNRVGEIDRRRAARQGDQAAVRRETEHLVMKEFELRMLQKFLGRGAFGEQSDRAAQPLVGAALARQAFLAGDASILVEGVRGNAVAGDVVHQRRAHLELGALAARPDDGRVDRLIIILLRRRNIILETARNDGPFGMHDADDAIAILDVFNDNAEAENVGELLESDRFALHLAPHRIGLFLASLHLGVDAPCGEFGGQLLLDRGDDFAVLLAQIVEPRGDHRIGIGHEMAKGQILEFVAHPLHAHAAGERRIDIEGFLGDPGALVRRHELQACACCAGGRRA